MMALLMTCVLASPGWECGSPADRWVRSGDLIYVGCSRGDARQMAPEALAVDGWALATDSEREALAMKYTTLAIASPRYTLLGARVSGGRSPTVTVHVMDWLDQEAQLNVQFSEHGQVMRAAYSSTDAVSLQHLWQGLLMILLFALLLVAPLWHLSRRMSAVSATRKAGERESELSRTVDAGEPDAAVVQAALDCLRYADSEAALDVLLRLDVPAERLAAELSALHATAVNPVLDILAVKAQTDCVMALKAAAAGAPQHRDVIDATITAIQTRGGSSGEVSLADDCEGGQLSLAAGTRGGELMVAEDAPAHAPD